MDWLDELNMIIYTSSKLDILISLVLFYSEITLLSYTSFYFVPPTPLILYRSLVVISEGVNNSYMFNSFMKNKYLLHLKEQNNIKCSLGTSELGTGT